MERRKDGPRTLSRIADPTLLAICSIVCESVERQPREKADAILGPAIRKP